MSAHDEDVTWLVNRADELGQHIGRMTADELRTLSRSLMDRRHREEPPGELFASALAASREALRRVTGRSPAPAVLEAVAVGVTGVFPAVAVRTDRQAALVMALYWHSLSRRGVHLVSWDERDARSALKVFDPVGRLLGCDTGLVTQATTGAARRSAYAAMVTFGSYQEMAADYLRDNLHDSREQVVQRGLHAAVLDEVNESLAPRALSYVVITAPRTAPEPQQVQGIAASFRRGSDYRPDRKQHAILFSPPAMARLKAAVGWAEPPSPKAVTVAEWVENAILRREGLGRSDGRDTLADISVLGYLAAYEALTGFSSRGERAASVDDVLAAGGRNAPHPRELSFERLIDRHRSTVYGFRNSVRDEPDTLSLIRPVASAAARAWLARGPEALTAGMRDALAGQRTREQIDVALNGAAHDELDGRAALLVEQALRERADALGAAQMAALLRKVFFTIVDVEWREHLLRMRFVQRQSAALYDPTALAGGAREVDCAELFAACEQAIRIESIKYALNVRL